MCFLGSKCTTANFVRILIEIVRIPCTCIHIAACSHKYVRMYVYCGPCSDTGPCCDLPLPLFLNRCLLRLMSYHQG